MDYSTGLPVRGLIPVLIENLKSFRDGWWLRLLLLAAVLGVAPLLRSNTIPVLSVAGIAITLYTIALWRSYRYQRIGEDFHIRSGLAEKLRVNLHTSQITRVDLERDQWCLLLGLANICIYTEGNNNPSAAIQYVTPKIAQQLAGDLLPHDSTEDDKDLFYRTTFLDAIKGACLVPSKQLLIPAMIIFAIAMPILSSSVERPDEKIMKDGAVEQASAVFTTVIHPGTISSIFVMTGILVIGLAIASRVFFALPYFLGTEVRVRDNQVFVKSGIFNLRQWRLRIEDISTVETRQGVWAGWFGGTAVVLQTRGAEPQPGMKGNYLPFLPQRKVAELFEITGMKPVLLPGRKLDLLNFLIDIGRLLVMGSPILLALVLFLPVTFWESSDLILYVAEASGLFLLLVLWRWRQHWNSGLAITDTHVKIGQRRWTNNHTTASLQDLHGIECYALPWAKNRIVGIRPGLPAVDQYITASKPWSLGGCMTPLRNTPQAKMS